MKAKAVSRGILVSPVTEYTFTYYDKTSIYTGCYFITPVISPTVHDNREDVMHYIHYEGLQTHIHTVLYPYCIPYATSLDICMSHATVSMQTCWKLRLQTDEAAKKNHSLQAALSTTSGYNAQATWRRHQNPRFQIHARQPPKDW